MIKVYSLTRQMEDFKDVFHNGTQVLEKIDTPECSYFWHKAQEVLIYGDAGKCLYSCCWTSAYNRNYITSVWSANGCEYEYDINYDAIGLEIKGEKTHENA